MAQAEKTRKIYKKNKIFEKRAYIHYVQIFQTFFKTFFKRFLQLFWLPEFSNLNPTGYVRKMDKSRKIILSEYSPGAIFGK